MNRRAIIALSSFAALAGFFTTAGRPAGAQLSSGFHYCTEMGADFECKTCVRVSCTLSGVTCCNLPIQGT
jgi:hypothetical protein